MQISTMVNGMIPANDPTPLVRLAVVEMGSAWRIFLDGRKFGRFTRRDDAVQCALEIARETRADGRIVEVLSQSAFGEVTVVADHVQVC